MAKNIVRKGDTVIGVCSEHGAQSGYVLTGASKSYCEGKLIARNGDTIIAECGHTGTIISSGTAKCEGESIAKLDDSFVGTFSGTLSTSYAEKSIIV